MKEWKSISGSEIIDSCIEDNTVRPLESAVEDAYKQNWLLASDGELKLLKLYYTDGFGWYYDKEARRIAFVLHECKVLGIDSEFKSVQMRVYNNAIRKALLQAIGYYNKIKNKSYTSFSKELKSIAKDFNYDDINQFIIDNFKLFLITCPNFVVHAEFDSIKTLVERLEEPMNKSTFTPSKYWKDPELKSIMEAWYPEPVEMIPSDKYDTTDTQKILNKTIN